MQSPAPSVHIQLVTGSTLVAMAIARTGDEPAPTLIKIKELIGAGTFGRVYKARLGDSGELVALKQVLYDPRYKQREVDILEALNHCNIVRLIMHCQVTMNQKTNTMLAMEYMPISLLYYLHHHRNNGHSVAPIYVRVLSYQIFRGLAYMHALHICHRDIKPENMLMDPQTYRLKLGDFGSAKWMSPGESSLTYVCSRLYRAPELLAKYDKYDTKVDIWSAGCVLAELIKTSPLFFTDEHDEALLLHIVKVLGSYGLERAGAVSAICEARGLTPQPRASWTTLLGRKVAMDLIELLEECLKYEASARIEPLHACAHACYDELRWMEALRMTLPCGAPLPPLFNFEPLELSSDPALWVKLLPLYYADAPQPVEQELQSES